MKKLALVLSLPLMALSPEARAVLGGQPNPNSVQGTAKPPAAQKLVAGMRNNAVVNQGSVNDERFTVYVSMSEGVTIREIVAPDGVVIGLAWEGSYHPDLTSLLGTTYYDDFKSAVDSAGKLPGRRPASATEGSDVVVKRSGHMGAMRGKAYLPELLEKYGVSPNDIR